MEATGKEKNSLQKLADYGQSPWLDFIRRDLITSGELKRLIAEEGLKGVTSNPAIFEKALSAGDDYKPFIMEHAATAKDAVALYEQIAFRDIQGAADILKSVYDESAKRDGYISLEVSPSIANDTEKTLNEARRLWKLVNRPNLMVKVPATPEGIPAVQRLIGEGININVTLLFSREAYRQIAESYIAGLEKYATENDDLSSVSSVASFFVSRIDSLIDSQIREKLKDVSGEEKTTLENLLGKVAIANAKMAYEIYQQVFSGERWERLAKKGAQTQRILWASTGTKDPEYCDVLYVEELIGEDTVNTIPPATWSSFHDHGRLRESLTENTKDAKQTLEDLERSGISLEKATDKLLTDAVRLFVEPYDKMIGAVEKAIRENKTITLNTQTFSLPKRLMPDVELTLKEWQDKGNVERLWAKDASLWTNNDEADWLGWLSIIERQISEKQKFADFAGRIKDGEFSHILLLGMGGASLCPEVLSFTFGKQEGFPELHILDSTDPAQIRATEAKIDLGKTLFFVSSKSGSTLEPNIFFQYFFDRVSKSIGKDLAGSRFVAITDPNSKLQKVAEANGFRDLFFGDHEIGGRYSALSDFGMIPLAAMGIDVTDFLKRARMMEEACRNENAYKNPGVVLGGILGTAARDFARDKLTIITSPEIYDLGAWLEQLIAESTGKQGKSVIPVDHEEIVSEEDYGCDRLFVYLKVEGDDEKDEAVASLESSGHPIVRIVMPDLLNLGQEFFRWEIATAVAGAIMKINPFDQPDVEASKIVTKKLTAEYEEKGSLPEETPICTEAGIKLFTDERNANELRKAVGEDKTLGKYINAHLDRIVDNDYFAILAYIEMNCSNDRQLHEIRDEVLKTQKVATCLGFGPRFLHSTGQGYKGGANNGVFLQITCDDAEDLEVPDQKYTFGAVKAAQARGDFEVLAERKRRALRVHLGKDVSDGLARLSQIILERGNK